MNTITLLLFTLQYFIVSRFSDGTIHVRTVQLKNNRNHPKDLISMEVQRYFVGLQSLRQFDISTDQKINQMI